MASHTTIVRSPNSAVEVFAYLAAFENFADWHPAAAESRRVTDGPALRVGARFHVVRGTGAWKVDRTYEVVDLIDGRCLVLRSDAGGSAATDSIVVTTRSAGCVVHYRSHVHLRGVRVAADPIVRIALRRAGAQVDERLSALLAL